ncbi:hypothetical protein FAJ35_08355 [Streptococcus suis]|uniref:Uncharacterized protein n=1 Tax=Streptococcus suis TaxID=1307 RepID=A0A3R8LZN0_STRSU|nr:hypothetical protein EI219_00375 [Streptococcus suis]RRR48817.1 hypothetical protein EJA00_05905 [Streptococcus suis]TII00705.1 hypothetical protein FAJ35_08355 [Streptococcus suis]
MLLRFLSELSLLQRLGSSPAPFLKVSVNISAQRLIGFNSLGIDCFSSTNRNIGLLTNSSMKGRVLPTPTQKAKSLAVGNKDTTFPRTSK